MKKSTDTSKQKEQLLKEVVKSMSRKYAAYLKENLKEKRESGDAHAID